MKWINCGTIRELLTRIYYRETTGSKKYSAIKWLLTDRRNTLYTIWTWKMYMRKMIML